MVALIPSQDLLCEHIQVPQLSPSPLDGHEPISQHRHSHAVASTLGCKRGDASLWSQDSCEGSMVCD